MELEYHEISLYRLTDGQIYIEDIIAAISESVLAPLIPRLNRLTELLESQHWQSRRLSQINKGMLCVCVCMLGARDLHKSVTMQARLHKLRGYRNRKGLLSQ